MYIDRFRPGYKAMLTAILFAAKACEAPPPTPTDVIAQARANAKPGIEETYTCINPIGTLVSVGSTEGDDTCVDAYMQHLPNGETIVFSNFEWRNGNNSPVTVCLQANIVAGEIKNPNNVRTVGTTCTELLDQPGEINE